MQHRATYCPEDNKLRFYPDWDDPDFDKEELKAAGYRWASKQECYVCPRWTPTAEDAALDYVDEIEDETYSPAERAADRAERFAGYRDNRRGDAHGYADRMGDAVAGFQDQRKADRAARKRDRLAGNALTQWDRAEYWHQRTAGVIAHAIGKESPTTRRLRIKRLEADQRKQTKSLEERAARLAGWSKVANWDGPEADVLLPVDEGGYGITDEANEAGRLAYSLANAAGLTVLRHPRDTALNDYAAELHGEYHRGLSPYSLLTDDSYAAYGPFERLTPREVAQCYLSQIADPSEAEDNGQRWARHYAMRLEFERAMLASEGGAADEQEIVPGGFILMRGNMGRWCLEHAPNGWCQVQKVHKSPTTKKTTSVEVWGVESSAIDGPKRKLVKVKIERFAADRYRAPTAEELEAFKVEQKAAKKKAKASKPKTPSLVNPTDNDAEALQALWNDRARKRWEKAKQEGRTYSDFVPQEVVKLTQAQYSAISKGSYAKAETRALHDGGWPARASTNLWSRDGMNYDAAIGEARCKIRQTGPKDPGGMGWYSADRVIVLTDKPQKPLPIDWDADPFEVPETAEANA